MYKAYTMNLNMIEIIMALQVIDDDDAKYRGLLADTIRARPPHIYKGLTMCLGNMMNTYVYTYMTYTAVNLQQRNAKL